MGLLWQQPQVRSVFLSVCGVFVGCVESVLWALSHRFTLKHTQSVTFAYWGYWANPSSFWGACGRILGACDVNNITNTLLIAFCVFLVVFVGAVVLFCVCTIVHTNSHRAARWWSWWCALLQHTPKASERVLWWVWSLGGPTQEDIPLLSPLFLC